MNRVLFFTGLLFLLQLSAMAQSFEVTAFSGYTFADKFPISGGSAKINDGHTYGGILSYNHNESYAFELLYSRQETRGSAKSSYLNLDNDEAISVNYILAGSNRMIPTSVHGAFFGGIKLGAVIFSPKLNQYSNVTKFAVGITGGYKHMLNDIIGIRLQANLYAPIIDAGANFWWSPGNGTSVGVSSYTPILQFGLNGGIVFKLGK